MQYLEQRFLEIVQEHTASLTTQGKCSPKRQEIAQIVQKGCAPVCDQRVAEIKHCVHTNNWEYLQNYISPSTNKLRKNKSLDTELACQNFTALPKNKDYALFVVLESPGKDEYHFTPQGAFPIAPAVGQTGSCFYLYLPKILHKAQALMPQFFTHNEFDVHFVEVISYPCSLGQRPQKDYPHEHIFRDQIFLRCWQDRAFEQDFLARLSQRTAHYSANKQLVLNACTRVPLPKSMAQATQNCATLKEQISHTLQKNLKHISLLSAPHPCSWYASNNQRVY